MDLSSTLYTFNVKVRTAIPDHALRVHSMVEKFDGLRGYTRENHLCAKILRCKFKNA